MLLAKDSIADSLKLVEARMNMIERIDKHPLSWPVATEYQKLKRMKAGNAEDDKLFSLAEKKVKEDKKSRNDEAQAKSTEKQRLSFLLKGQPKRFGNTIGAY